MLEVATRPTALMRCGSYAFKWREQTNTPVAFEKKGVTNDVHRTLKGKIVGLEKQHTTSNRTSTKQVIRVERSVSPHLNHKGHDHCLCSKNYDVQF
jgi:hypothetical protein